MPEQFHAHRPAEAESRLELASFLRAERRRTRIALAHLNPLRLRIEDEISGRRPDNHTSAPFRRGAYLYYERHDLSRQHPLYLRRGVYGSQPEQTVLDLDAWRGSRGHVELLFKHICSRGDYLAFGIDRRGDRSCELYIQHIDTGALLRGPIEGVVSFAWTAVPGEYFYILHDRLLRPAVLARGSIARSETTILYVETNDQLALHLATCRSGEYVMAVSGGHAMNEVRVLSAVDLTTPPFLISAGRPDHFYQVDHQADQFFVLSNRSVAEGEIYQVRVEQPHECNWSLWIGSRPGRIGEAIETFRDVLVFWFRRGGLPHFAVFDRHGRERFAISGDQSAYELYSENNFEYAATEYRCISESLSRPRSVIAYDLASGAGRVLETYPVPRYDPSRYSVVRREVVANDGTRIPVSLVAHRDRPQDQKCPLLLAGYGSYGLSYSLAFSHALPSLLDRGVAFAIAHVRGGGEFGRSWHKAARGARKSRAIADFLCVAEALCRESYSTAKSLACRSGSAGGVLVGAALNRAPGAFAAAVLDSPFLDVVGDMQQDDIPLTSLEYVEWGDPRDFEQRAVILDYSPCANVVPAPYPAVLVNVNLNDVIVPPTNAFAYVRALREASISGAPILLNIQGLAGHAGASARAVQDRHEALVLAFILSRVGIV
ncbi:prolyl oligopeptidase family serine peptidase [Mesorhizobium mediterraneum]|uniref:prolyl oligopeptidase family serine peptidase n=1 Tax=Mesorhizobium mediterraneum TaxID=43617 RepID=UPI0017825703|nr:prolyl oligopeptidase family serine peptidase [Mesorhizobium mediterraneum]